MSLKHNVKTIRIGRSFNQRKALQRQLINDLIKHGSIVTTITKAKWIRSRFDKLAYRSKTDSLHNIRLIASRLASPKSALKLIKDIGPKFSQNTGFTKMTKIKIRRGDNATMVKLELIIPSQGTTDQPKNVQNTKLKKTNKNK